MRGAQFNEMVQSIQVRLQTRVRLPALERCMNQTLCLFSPLLNHLNLPCNTTYLPTYQSGMAALVDKCEAILRLEIGRGAWTAAMITYVRQYCSNRCTWAADPGSNPGA